MRLHPRHTPAARAGYVIFAVLIVIVVLSLVAYRFTESMTSEYRAGVRTTDDAQARMAAVSGLHYAAAILSDRNTLYGELDGNPFDNETIFRDFEVPGVGTVKKGRFSIICVAPAGDGSYEQRFGVIDEASKININSLFMMRNGPQLLHDVLMKLPNMTEDVADSIVDWLDPDDDPRPSGAESSYYQGLPQPYRTKNGPMNSLDELLLVKGMTPQLLYGDDRNRNGVQDEGELSADRGWADYLTVYGRELNVDVTGVARIYLNGDDLNAIYQQLTTAVGEEMAAYAVASKLFRARRATTSMTFSVESGALVSGSAATSSGGTMALAVKVDTTVAAQPQQNQRPTRAATTEELIAAVKAKMEEAGSSGSRIRSVLTLMDTQITLPRPQDAPQDAPDVVAYSPLSDPAKRNQLLPLLMDRTTVRQAIEMVPRVNVNTAPREVLLALTGITNSSGTPILTDVEVDQIVNTRGNLVPGDPATNSAAWLITVANMSPDTFRRLEPYVTGSTMVYRVQSIGYLAGGGPVSRLEAVIDTNQGAPRFLHVRDLSDLDNPRAFEPPREQLQ
jgi:hypothetical protein